MKKLEFETSKGRFIVTDMKGEIRINNAKWFKKLSEITENQASEILEEFHKNNFGTITNPDYGFYDYTKDDFHLNSSIKSLHSLLKSKGIKITNNTYIFKL